MPEMAASEMLSKTPSLCTLSGRAEFKENISRRHHELDSFHHQKSFAWLVHIAHGFLTPGLGNSASLRRRLGK